MRRISVSMVVAAIVVGGMAAGPDGKIQGFPPTARAEPPQEPVNQAPEGQHESRARKNTAAASSRERIEASLDRTCTLDVAEMPLKDVVIYLQQTHGFPIYLRKKKLEEAGISLDTPVKFSLSGIPLRSALDLLLGELELTYTVNKDVLLITSPEDAENDLETRVYDCRDLLAMSAPEIHGHPASADISSQPSPSKLSDKAAEKAPAGSEKHKATEAQRDVHCSEIPGSRRHGSGGIAVCDSSTEAEKRTDWLIGLIRATVDTYAWDDVGGGGAIDSYNGLLVVSQSYRTHRAIERLLDDLRATGPTKRTNAP